MCWALRIPILALTTMAQPVSSIMRAHTHNNIQETLSQFEAAFVDEHTGSTRTVTFFKGEPIIYQAPHLPTPILTHIDTIARDHFMAACSGTARMIPTRQAQRVLHLKLSLDDVEREVNGTGLAAGERIIWRRWLESENRRRKRRIRATAPCVYINGAITHT